jgi:hypothetical protein
MGVAEGILRPCETSDHCEVACFLSERLRILFSVGLWEPPPCDSIIDNDNGQINNYDHR